MSIPMDRPAVRKKDVEEINRRLTSDLEMEQVVSIAAPTQIRAAKVRMSDPTRNVVTLKRTQEMQQVDAQVSKIAKIFKEREQASQELAQTINRANAQLNHVWRMTLQERHRNARLSTSNDQAGDVLAALKKHVENLGKCELDPLNNDFERVEITDKNTRSLAEEMESDIAGIAAKFKSQCLEPLVFLREEISRLREEHARRIQDVEHKNQDCILLRAQVDQQSLNLDEAITEKLALTTGDGEKGHTITILQTSIEKTKNALETNKGRLDELVQWTTNEELKKQEEMAAARASLEGAKEESLALDAEIERAHTSKHAHLQIADAEKQRAEDQSTRCSDARKRTAELEVRKAELLANIADVKAREECAQKDIQIMHQQQQLAHAKVDAAQETTSSLVESIARQQLLMTETVLKHDERQAQQSKLYQAVQVQKDSQRTTALQNTQLAKNIKEEVQRQKEAASQQEQKLSLLRTELHEASQARYLQQQTADKELVAAAEAEEALRAHVEARMQCYAEDLQVLVAAKEVEVQDAVQKHKETQQQEREMGTRVHTLASKPNTLAESTRLLPDLQCELDRLIAESMEEQKLSFETALQEKLAPQLQALSELTSGKRLEAERQRSEAAVKELESKIKDTLRTKGEGRLGRVKSPSLLSLCVADFEEKEEFRPYIRLNAKQRRPALPSQPVSPLSPLVSNISPVKASPRDWFSDTDMW